MVAAAEKTRVLIIEDEREVARLMQAVLEDEGYEVMVHPNGNCWDAVRSFQPRVIICDYMLPVTDGATVARRLRSEMGLPCIMVSAVPTASDNWRAWGADEFIAKPFDLERLISTVGRAAGGDTRLSTQSAAGLSDQRAS